MNRREDESEAPQFPGIEGRAPYKAPEDFYSFYETVLNLKESMGRLDERSKTQEKKLDEVSKEVKDVSRIVLKAKTAIYTLAAVITLAASVIGWFLSHLIGVFQALQ